MPEPDGRGSDRAALPPNARIVVVSAGFGEPGGHYDEADELARQLHDFGWWVDLPRGAGVASSRPPRRFAGVRRVARGPNRTRFDRVATQTASRLGPDAHAVVATHSRMAAALGRVRLRGTFVGPLIA